MNDIGKSIWKSILRLLGEVALFCLTLATFINVMNEHYDKAMVFTLMIIAIELERIGDKLSSDI